MISANLNVENGDFLEHIQSLPSFYGFLYGIKIKGCTKQSLAESPSENQ